MAIYRHLREGENAASVDCNTFNKWMEGTITTAEMMARFRKNNLIKDDETIDEAEMINWLSSIGYRRKKR